MISRFLRPSIAALFLIAWLPATQAQLPEPVTGMLRAANIPEDAMGVVVLRLPDGVPLLTHGAERSMQPGSTMKLLTTLVALDRLGPTYRGRAELRTNGKVENNVLEGDLVLRGGGDTDLGWEAFQGMLQSLRNQGIETIRGNLLLDRRLFNPPRPDLGAAPFDEAPEFDYNLIPDALLLNGNLLRFELASDEHRLTVNMTPTLDRVTVGTDMTLVELDCKDWDKDWLPPEYIKADDGAIRVLLHGKYPKNCTKSPSINVLDRVDFADRLFRMLWTRLGGKFLGNTRDAAMPADTRLLAEHQSRPLPVVVRDINKQSDNALARMIYLTLGTASGGASDSSVATTQLSEQVVRAWLKEHGIDDQGLVLENGSGLSRLERIRPAQLAAVLLNASRNTLAPEYLSSLPIAGVDGTMRLRLLDSPAAGRARIKTGTLKGVFGVAGYVPDASNRPCIVVALLNHEPTGNAVGRAILDTLIDSVARSGAEPSAK
ncbi:MAG: D-alanyl-D-alanine carboxypeptidase/D-alanyl-D-alanine-endopeptidase [Proteobacteria bacterium]|nr:D-alanyl-D-alanine carboxypeptidase/D-alanyl-D-alanine-endopeptidase [Pseudomonadota bacterium]